MSDPAVKKRLDKAVEFLDAVMACQLADKAPGAAVRWAGAHPAQCRRQLLPRARQQDDQLAAACGLRSRPRRFLAPGTDRQAWCRGDRAWRTRSQARSASATATLPAAAKVCTASAEGANQADFIVRVGWNAFSLIGQDGADFDHQPISIPCRPTWRRTRVILQRQGGRAGPAAAAAPDRPAQERRRRPKPPATSCAPRLPRKQKKLDPRSLIAAEFLILATSLPAAQYPAGEVLAVYRLRWQIELAFKRLKSLLHIDRLPTFTEEASRSWLYAHLILALLCDEISQEFLESSP